MSKKVGATTTAFAWDNSPVPLLLQDGNTYTIYGPTGAPVEQITGTAAQYLHQDQLDSTRLITNSTGAVVGTYRYTPYGKVTTHTGPVSTHLQYNGQYADQESGLTYLRNRYYDPTTAGFLTVDPLIAVTRNAYGYATNSPESVTDPTGLYDTNAALSSAACAVTSLLTFGSGGLATGVGIAVCSAL